MSLFGSSAGRNVRNYTSYRIETIMSALAVDPKHKGTDATTRLDDLNSVPCQVRHVCELSAHVERTGSVSIQRA